MKVETQEHQTQSPCLSAGHWHSSTWDTVLGTSLTYNDPSYAANTGQHVGLMKLRYKTSYFYQKSWGTELRQLIYSNRSHHHITWEQFHRTFLSSSKNRKWKEMQKHLILLLIHHFLSYCFDAQMSFLTLKFPFQGRCAVNLVQDAKTSLQKYKTPSRASPLIFSHLTAFTAVSAKAEHKAPLSAHRGNCKRSYLIPQPFWKMDKTPKHESRVIPMRGFVLTAGPAVGQTDTDAQEGQW